MTIMNKLEKTLFVSYWLMRYLSEYMPTIKNLSHNTLISYRDCYKQYLPFIAKKAGKHADELLITDITVNRTTDFLSYIEKEKACSIKTRNHRLSAIKAFAHYVSSNAPEYMEWSRLMNTIPIKKVKTKVVEGCVLPYVSYLDKNEIDALLNAPDKKTKQGRKDYAILLFLYNTGARASEAASLTIGCIIYDNASCPLVRIYGKGNKSRTCPLWDRTLNAIKPLIIGRHDTERVFLNRYGNPITRFGIYELLQRNVAKAVALVPTMVKKNVSPHTLRHTAACHLYESGNDIVTIQSWLGHVSINTTNIYTEVSMQMKEKAIMSWTVEGKENITKQWKENKGILNFLKSL